MHKLATKIEEAIHIAADLGEHGAFDHVHGRGLHLIRQEIAAEVEQLAARVLALEVAIRQHRDERGHDRCWLDDRRLYGVLPESVVEEEFVLPSKADFLKNCTCYWESRQPKLPIDLSDYCICGVREWQLAGGFAEVVSATCRGCRRTFHLVY